MRLIEILFEIAINLFEGWMYCYVISRKFTLRPEIGRIKAASAMIATIVAIAAFYSAYIWIDLKLTDTVVWIFPMIYALVLFEEHWANKTAWIICFATLALSVIDAITAILMTTANLGWEDILTPSLLRVISVLICNGLMFLVLYLASSIRIGQSRLSFYALCVYTILNIVVTVMLEMLFNMVTQGLAPGLPLMTIIYCLLGVEIGLFLLFEVMSYYAEQKYELETAAKLNLIKEEHNEEIRTMYHQIQDYRHDLKHHFAVLQNMIQKGEIQKSEAYLDEIKDLSMENQIFTGSIAVDAILSLKQTQMQQHGIHFEFKKYPVQGVLLGEADFCTLLGNLLDNAIEAEMRMKEELPEKTIRLSFSQTFSMFHISCMNTFDPSQIHMRGNDFLSSKRENQIGIGIPRIRQIVEEADGHCSYRMLDQTMIVEIMLPAKGE